MMLRKSDPDSASLTADILKQGKIAILPTDTVYGFSAVTLLKNKKSGGLDKKIDAIKKSPEFKPLIELISAPEDIFKYAENPFLPTSIYSKWPGPLTVIIENNSSYEKITGRATSAFRCPGDEWLRSVIALCGSPLYSTSVNFSGKPVLNKIDDIRKEFESAVDLIIDDGDKIGGCPSTIVSLVGNELKIVRQGQIIVD